MIRTPLAFAILSALCYFVSFASACALHSAHDDAYLSTAVRQVDARDFTGTFSSILKVPACAAKLKHDGLVQGGNAVAHGNITVNGVRCAANGRMNLFPATNADRVSAAIGRFEGLTKSLAETVVASAQKFPGSYIGTSNAARVCGSFTYKPGTMFVFVKANRTFPTVSGIPDLPAKKRNMVSIQPGQGFVCPSSAKLRESPTPRPNAIRPARPNVTAPVTKPAVNTTGITVFETPGPTFSPDPVIAGEGPQPIGDGTALEASPAPGGGSVCFPSDATVELEDGTYKAMSNIEIGDSVRVSTGKYSPVFMFTHKVAAVQHAFVQITAENGRKIELTSGHYLLVNGQMKPASSVNIGDNLSTVDETAAVTVTDVKSVVKNGLYNPQTVDGTIVVNGVVASTYTTAVELTTAHTMLAPLRAAFEMFGMSFKFLDAGADKMASVLPEGKLAY